MESGVIILIYLVLTAIILPIPLWGAYLTLKKRNSGKKNLLLSVASLATVASVGLLIFISYIFYNVFDGSRVETDETRTVVLENGDEFKVRIRVQFNGFKLEYHRSIEIKDKNGARCVFLSDEISVNQKDKIPEDWDKIELMIAEEDLKIYKTIWGVFYKDHYGYQMLNKNDYNKYSNYVSVYERVNGASPIIDGMQT